MFQNNKRELEILSLKRLKSEVESKKQQIGKTCENLRQKIDQKEQNLIEELDRVYNDTKCNLDERDRKLSCLDKCRDNVVNIRDNKLTDVMYQTLLPISEEIEKLLDKSLVAPSVELDLNEKLLENVQDFCNININICPYTERVYPEWMEVEKGTCENEMEEPFSILSLDTNELLISDRNKNVINVYSQNGEYISTIKDTNLNRPLYMCSYKDAFFVTCGVQNGKVLKFEKNEQGNWEMVQLQRLNNPITGINVDEQGILYVFETKKRNIFALETSNLDIITQLELETEHFVQGRTRIMDSKLHNSEWYVLFSNSEYTIQCFHKNGKLKRTVIDSSQFNGGLHFCIDNAGNIIGSESLTDKVKVFSNDGQFITKIGSGGDFTNPRGVTLDAKGRVFVCDLKSCDMLSCY
ncbi:hypothetical protein LOD99_7248 [Oopsacas minuta]|uniref:Uncharacterized protein n=1 Tax=Oopsacas minuta TaxID=111878 RepID=A0AAV7JU70_9METZ|nr:hypothetical protein LOD99_7248 [Oopsacas minuta]